MGSANRRRPPISKANRGAGLENLVMHACEAYRRSGVGCVQKIATPVRQPSRAGSGDAWHREKSTVDFLGVLAGWPIAFDCKETRQARFDLERIKPHQRKFLADFTRSGGRSFVLVEFVRQREVYAVSIPWLDLSATCLERKSVPYEAFADANGDTGIKKIPIYGDGQPLPFGLALEAAGGRI